MAAGCATVTASVQPPPTPAASIGPVAAPAEPPLPLSPLQSGDLATDEAWSHFFAKSQAARLATVKGAPMPGAALVAWSSWLGQVEQYGRTKRTVVPLSRLRLFLEGALELDGQRYGDVPFELAVRIQAALEQLTAQLGALAKASVRADVKRFVWPLVDLRVTSAFGHRFHPILGDYRFHSGVDLEAEPAQAVMASAAGTVVFAGWNSGHGKQVELQHDAHVSTRYSHLMTVLVREGDQVKPGDVIGLAGKTGQATGVHLHFELRRDGQAVNPESEIPQPVSAVIPVQNKTGPGFLQSPSGSITAQKPSEGLFELFGRAEADGLRRLQLHDLVGLRVANLAGLAAAHGPGPEAGVAEAVVLLHGLADVREDHVDDFRRVLLGQLGLQRHHFDELCLGHVGIPLPVNAVNCPAGAREYQSRSNPVNVIQTSGIAGIHV